MFESREYDLLARLFDLACEKDLVENRVDLDPKVSMGEFWLAQPTCCMHAGSSPSFFFIFFLTKHAPCRS